MTAIVGVLVTAQLAHHHQASSVNSWANLAQCQLLSSQLYCHHASQMVQVLRVMLLLCLTRQKTHEHLILYSDVLHNHCCSNATLKLQAAVDGDDDETEAFERMQQAQLGSMDPDSSAFFAARKQARRKQAGQTQRSHVRPARRA